MPETTTEWRLVGRRSSLFVRIPLWFADALDVPVGFEPVMDMRRTDLATYAGNPALKVPVLCIGEQRLFGAAHIARRIAAAATVEARNGIVWPEDLHDPLLMNAQELVSHCSGAQVQLVMGPQVCGLAEDNLYFVKARAGLLGSLQWLEDHLEQILASLPASRSLSYFEVSLFCMLDHLSFRRTVELPVAFTRLHAFLKQYGTSGPALNTAYRYDR